MTRQEIVAQIALFYNAFTEEEKIRLFDEIERLKQSRESFEVRPH